jgi:hypothetical protein
MRSQMPIATPHLGCRVPRYVSTPPGGHLAGSVETRPIGIRVAGPSYASTACGALRRYTGRSPWMVDRWTVERAVKREDCGLEPPGRQLVLTLLTWTDHDTAKIPERYTPSLTAIQGATGLARSTIADWLNKLEDRWVVRKRPTVTDARRKKSRTVYQMQVPPDVLERMIADGTASPAAGPARRDSKRPAGPTRGPARAGAVISGPGRGPESDWDGPTAELELVRLPDRVGPPTGRRPYREQENGVGRSSRIGHPYIEGPNGTCARPGCTKSAPLHDRHLAAVPNQERRGAG